MRRTRGGRWAAMVAAVVAGALTWPVPGSGQGATPVSFRPVEYYPTGGGVPVGLAAGDVTGDDDLDLVVPTIPAGDGAGGALSVLAGDRKGGRFSAPGSRTFPIGSSAGAVALADLAPAEGVDLVALDPAAAEVVVLAARTGPGGVSFGPPVTYATGGKDPSALGVGDVDGNGAADLVVVNRTSNNVSLRLAAPDGTFEDAPQLAAVGADPVALVVADLIGSRAGAAKAEIAVANRGAGSVSVLVRDKDGTVGRTDYDVGLQPSALAAADLDGDELLDLVALDAGGTLVTLAGRRDGKFTVSETPTRAALPGSGALAGLVVGQFNGDDDPDLAVVSATRNSMWVLLGESGLTFSEPLPVALGAPGPGGASALVTGDFDADGDDDLAATRAGEAEVAVLLNNAVPTAVPDRYQTDEDTPLTVAAPGVLENDAGVEEEQLKAKLVQPPKHGTVTLSADGAFEYTPGANFDKTDSFTYTVTDDGGATSEPGTVEIVVLPVNDAPVAVDDRASTDEDEPVSLKVLENDTDVEGDRLKVVNATGARGGAVKCDTRTCTFTPGADYEGLGGFEYTVSDGHGGTATGKVSITVAGLPDDPRAHDDFDTTAEGMPVTIFVTDNDVEVDAGDSLEIPPASNTQPKPKDGPAPIPPSTAYCSGSSCTYTPSVNFSGVETFTYTVEDTTGRKSTATVTVTVTDENEIPEAREDRYTTTEDGTLAIDVARGVLANDVDGDQEPLQAVLVRGTPPPAQLELRPDGSFTYTPPPEFSGTDSFTYQAYDGKADSPPATVTITVTEVNDPPVAEPDVTTTREGRPVDVFVTGNDFDPDGDELTVSVEDGPVHGRVECNGNRCSYRPVAHYIGDDTFTYSVTDGRGGVASAVVSITIFPDGPRGYWLLGAEGSLYSFGPAADMGDPPGRLEGTAAVDLEPSPSGNGYWVLDDRGGVHAFGDATPLGSVDPFTLGVGDEARALELTSTGQGYWVITAAGRVYPFGDAASLGDLAERPPAGPILDAAATPNGGGYYLVGTDGEVYAFGNAVQVGSLAGQSLNSPVVSIAADPDGTGYWLTAADGGVFGFDAPFWGSMAGTPLNAPVVAIAAYGTGYLLVAEDGGVFVYSDRPFEGSLGSEPPARPVTSGVIF